MPQVFLKYSTGSGCVTKVLPDNFLAQTPLAKQRLPSTTTEPVTQTEHLYAEPTIHEAMCQLLPTIFTQPQHGAFPQSTHHHTSPTECHTIAHNICSDFNMICNNMLLHPNHLAMSFSTFCEAMIQPATTPFSRQNTNDLTIHLLPKLRGGKGGFGANLRSGAPKKKKQPGDDNQMRTLTGERLGRVQEREMMAQFEADLRAEQRASGNGHLNEVTRVRLDKKKPNNNNNTNNNNNVQNTNSFSGFAVATTTSVVAERKNELSAMQLALQKKLAPKTTPTTIPTTTTTTTTQPKPTTTTSSSALDFGFDDYSDSDDDCSDSEARGAASTTQAVETVVLAEETKEKPDAPQEPAAITPTPSDDKETQQNQPPTNAQTTEQQ